MKIQSLAVIFIIIILPISLVISSYTQNRVETLRLQTTYDSKLNDSTHDALKAYQLNSFASETSTIIDEKIRDINASANTFFNSLASNFATLGYTKSTLQNYVPALVYTMYDGYYIYSPYKNTWSTDSGKAEISGEMKEQINEDSQKTYSNGENLYGLKPYIYLLVIGALVLMFNQIGDYEKAQSKNKKNSQLAEFNNDYERYLDDKGINGTDVISLINKVMDYNKRASKGGTANSVNYDIKMSITVSGLNAFNVKYAYDGTSANSLFSNDTFTFNEKSTNNSLKKLLDDFSKTEGNLGIEEMKKLAYEYDASKGTNDNISNIKKKLLEIDSVTYSNWNGSTSPTLNTIKKYRQYSEFKSSTFVQAQDTEYQDGQIQSIYLKFSK